MIGLIILILVFFLGVFLSGIFFSDKVEFFVFFLFWLVFWFFISYIIIYLTTGLYPNYSEGERIGYIVKFSRKGLLFKTYDGELQLTTGDVAVAQSSFEFNVVDKDIILKFKTAMNTRKLVKVSYTEYLIPYAKIGSSGYVVTSILEL
jgi:hypothetical protein